MERKLSVDIRWAKKRDLADIAEIEESVFLEPLTEAALKKTLQTSSHIGIVATYGNQIAGYAIYVMFDKRIHLSRFAVHEDARYKKVGTQIIEHLKDRLSKYTRSCLSTEVPDSNLDAQLFFKSLGFSATGIMPSDMTNTGEDAILMEFCVDDLVTCE